VLGKLIPYVVLASINFFVLWGLALTVFQVPFRGSPALFAVIGVLYVICTTLMGMMISFFVSSQIAAVLFTVIATLLPTLQYSGMLVPLSSLSEFGQIQARMLPASYFYEAALASFLKGAGIRTVWIDIVALSAYAVVLFTFCCLKFSKRPRS
jgi:ABC-2 type transport system permease protein/ribosome-dependent ATPase